MRRAAAYVFKCMASDDFVADLTPPAALRRLFVIARILYTELPQVIVGVLSTQLQGTRSDECDAFGLRRHPPHVPAGTSPPPHWHASCFVYLRDAALWMDRRRLILRRIAMSGRSVEERLVTVELKEPVAKAPLHSTGDASRLDCVARRSHISNMLAPRALPAGRLTGLGATRGFTTDS